MDFVLVNGKLTNSLPISDRGLNYGDGVFETIAVIKQRPQLIEEHLARLNKGCEKLSITAPAPALLVSEIKSLCKSADDQAVLKIIITRGSGGRGYRPDKDSKPARILTLHPWGEHIFHYREQGIRLSLCATRLSINPVLAGIKHLNRLEQVLASIELSNHVQEGLMRDYNDHVIEGTMSNLFIISTDNVIKTPSLKQCGIDGIMRRRLIDWLATRENKSVEETSLTLDDLHEAKHVMMTNSIIGIWPVVYFEKQHYAIPDFVTRFNRSIINKLD